jgi:SAM-dependent methyltransferase
MTTTTEPPQIDEVRVEQFVGRLLTDFAGAAATALTVIGERLGLYRAMTGAGPRTAAELADDAGVHRRLVTEWLGAQTVSGYLTYDPAAETFELPAEHAMALSRPDSPAYLMGQTEIITSQYLMLEHLERALRGGGGIEWPAFPTNLFDGVERFFRTAYLHELPGTWFPAVPGLVDRLEAGARVADIGCGHGMSTLLMARHWPASSYVGLDFHERSIVAARANADKAGGPANVSFRVADATDPASGPFDVVVFFDALHDMGDPHAALRRAHESLGGGGIVVAVEPWSTDRLEDGIDNPVVRLGYAISTSVCTPCSLAQPPGYGLGNQGGPGKRLELLADAGFRNPIVAADTGLHLVIAATR